MKLGLFGAFKRRRPNLVQMLCKVQCEPGHVASHVDHHNRDQEGRSAEISYYIGIYFTFEALGFDMNETRREPGGA